MNYVELRSNCDCLLAGISDYCLVFSGCWLAAWRCAGRDLWQLTAFSSTERPCLFPHMTKGAGILPTLTDVQAQLGPHDNVLVVADNCTDDTADIAKAAGVEVVVRVDPARRGKGYALEFGVQHLAINPPDVVVILDADCRLGEGALRHLSGHAIQNGCPAQALYLMLAPENAGSGKGVNLFAWRVKNWIRPLGLRLLGLPNSALRHRHGLSVRSARGPRHGK